MGRCREELRGGRLLDLLATVHDRHAVRPLRDQAQVVRDQQQRHREVAAQAVEQLQDLRLDGHVKCRRGFIGHQQTWLAGHRHGDHHALALATRELVRVVVDAPLWLRDTHQVQQLQGARTRGLCRQALVQAQRLADLVAHGVHRVQRAHRLLEDHGDVAPAHLLQRRGWQLQDVLALQQHPALDARVASQQAQQRERGGGLAAARLPHQCHGFAPAHLQVQLAHGV